MKPWVNTTGASGASESTTALSYASSQRAASRRPRALRSGSSRRRIRACASSTSGAGRACVARRSCRATRICWRASRRGIPRRDRAAYQGRVGFLAAGDRGLYARLTAQQHLELWGRVSLLGRDRLRRAVGEAVERLELGELAEQRMDRLSMGQRQRVRLAMAFLHEPDLVLLDEPLNSLDGRGADLLRAWLAELAGRGGGALWCSPAPGGEAAFDLRLVLEGGVLLAEPSP